MYISYMYNLIYDKKYIIRMINIPCTKRLNNEDILQKKEIKYALRKATAGISWTYTEEERLREFNSHETEIVESHDRSLLEKTWKTKKCLSTLVYSGD